MSLRDRAKKAQAKAVDVNDIKGTVEATVRLYARATGNHSNQYRGWMDRAGTVRFRVYSSISPAALRGEILTVNVDDGYIGPEADLETDEIVKYEFDYDENTLVVMWAPLDSDIQKAKITVG